MWKHLNANISEHTACPCAEATAHANKHVCQTFWNPVQIGFSWVWCSISKLKSIPSSLLRLFQIITILICEEYWHTTSGLKVIKRHTPRLKIVFALMEYPYLKVLRLLRWINKTCTNETWQTSISKTAKFKCPLRQKHGIGQNFQNTYFLFFFLSSFF